MNPYQCYTYPKFSLNHIVIGTRPFGSFPYKSAKDWIPHPNSYWVEQQGNFKKWRAEARVGDKYYVDGSVYWARIT